MKRRDTIVALLALGAAPLTSIAQQPGKVWHIGFLAGSPRPPDGLPPAALRQALAELGYVEGRNVVYEGRWSETKVARLPDLAAELVKLRLDAIVVIGAPPTQALKHATSTIPIITAGAGDAVGIGLVTSLAQPGGNLTGVTDLGVELSGKRLQLLKQAVPTAARIVVLWNADDRSMTLRYQQVEKAARALSVVVTPLGVREPEDFEMAFSTMTREPPDALFMVSDVLTSLNRKRVIEFTAKHRIPAMYEYNFLVQDGGLMSYGPSFDDTYRRVAYYVDRILKGTKPGDLPIEQPTLFYLYVNQKTAKALGIAIPDSFLARADRVIE